MSKNIKIKGKPNNPKGNDMMSISPCMIDKLSGVANFANDGLNNVSFEACIDLLNDNDVCVFNAFSKGKYGISLRIHYPIADEEITQQNPHVLLQLTHPKAAKKQARVEYNPNYMTPKGAEWLDLVFTMIFDMTFCQFLHHCKFTRIDWCRDIMGCDIENFLVSKKWAKASFCVFAPKTGKLQTITLGTSKGQQLIVYNKAAEMHGDNTTQQWVRVEARMRINQSAQDLKHMLNPFEHSVFYNVGNSNPPFGQGHWRAFQDSCRLRGIPNALKMQPVKDRPKIKKALCDKPVSWWGMSGAEWVAQRNEAYKKTGLANIPLSAPPLLLNYQAA